MDHSFVFIVDNRKSFRRDLRKPFDIPLKGSFQLINAVIPSVERTKKDSGTIYTVTGSEPEKNEGNLSGPCIAPGSRHLF